MQMPTTGKLPTVAPVTFIKEVIAELKKVHWPSRAETTKLTVVVLAVSVLVGMFIGSLDILFLNLTSIIFKQ